MSEMKPMSVLKSYSILKLRNDEKTIEEDSVVVEYTLSIYLNGQRYVNLICTPQDLRELVIGNLFSEGVIQSAQDIEELQVEPGDGRAMVRLKCSDLFRDHAGVPEGIRTVTTACGKQHSISYYLFNDLSLSALAGGPVFPLPVVRSRIQAFQKESALFLATGGVHSCALCDIESLLYFVEDIGRHNAFDKVLGFALKDGVDLSGTFLLTSGRVPSDMMIKAVRARIPVIISRSAPTDVAIDMARRYNVTLGGFARGTRLNLYSGLDRIAGGQSMVPPPTTTSPS